jgi:tetratricopeptide (TPR) repeat protein
MFSLSVFAASSTAAEPSLELMPGTAAELQVAAGSAREVTVDLPAGTASNLDLIQRTGFVDLELRGDGMAALSLRTEAGVDGLIQAPLLASKSAHWIVLVSARAGKGAATVSLRLSSARSIIAPDSFESTAFEHYVEAERLRRANYRETVVTARSEEIDTRTRDAYQAAETEYAAAADGCGLRRARIGRARMEVALGNYVLARSVAETAMGVACDGDLAERAQALKTIAMAAAYQGDFKASADADEQALALYEKTGDLRYQGIVLGNASAVYMQLGATDRALAAANGALRAAEATADGQGVVFSHKSIADIHLARGELAIALQEYRGTLADLKATPYPMIEAETWNELGIVYHRMADYQESLKSYANAEIIWKKMSSRGGEADTRINEAQTLLELSRRHAAAREFNAALTIARADGLKSIETRALRGLGAARLDDGDLSAARLYFSQSLVLARATGEITAESYALRALGDVDLRQGHIKAARRNDETALKLERDSADRDGEAATLAQLAHVLAADGDLEGARGLIGQALAIVETQRGRIDDPSLRTSYFASMRAYADTQVDLLMQLDARSPGADYASAALGAAERARARSLQDMFAEKSIAVARSIPPDLAESLHGAEERLRTAAFQLGHLDRDTGAARRTSLMNEFDEASHALDEVRGRVRSANPRYADLIQPVDLNLDAVPQDQLDGDVAVLEYWLGPRGSYVWIIARGSSRAVRLAPRAQIEGLCQDLTNLLRAPGRGSRAEGFEALAALDNREASAVQEAARRLASALIGPVGWRGLPQRIAIVADGCLQSVPFGVLPSSTDGRSLGATHDVSYLPSITTLKWLRRAAGVGARSPSLAIFAAPVPKSSVAPLPYSRVEADAIAALFPKDRVWLAVGPEASRANVLAADWGRFTIVHFAAHALVDARRPELSGVILSSSGGDSQDGVLRMNDIYNLDMPVDLVVLSGCETAVGRDVDSEGVFSLSRAFFYAGVPRVVASLWPVEDRATAAFMSSFYRALIVEHMSTAGALRFAQQSLARDSRWSAPYYWAGFVLQGDWN